LIARPAPHLQERLSPDAELIVSTKANLLIIIDRTSMLAAEALEDAQLYSNELTFMV
jgi:hypothetical protein